MGREAAFLTGGEMGARMRAHDWSRSPIGPLEAWPAPLRMAVSLMLNSAFPMFIAWGRELGFIYNDAYAEILGNKHPAALGCPFEVIWSEIWPDINPLIQRAMAGEATFSADLPLRMMRRGQYEDTWFTFSYSPVREEDGRVAGMFCCCVETTAGVRSQAELAELNIDLERQVTERSRERDRLWRNTQDIQVIIDGAGVFHAVNPAFTAILGWTPEDVIGRPVFDFVLPDDEALTRRALEHARVESLPVAENRYRHKNGGFRWISWVAAPEAKLIYASGRHITAEKEQADALSRTEEALRQAQKMEAVGQLTGGLAHDFNNLLAGISGSLELMQTRMQQGRLTDVDRYMTAAQGAAKRAAALTHRLLAFSRRQTLDPKPTDVSRLAMGMHELIQRTVGPGILVEVVGATGAWPALVDPPQLENALLNLCINARDAMPDGGIITIETANKWMDERAARQHDMPEGQYLSLAVTDTGTGMPPEVVARAFDPFFTTKPIGEGTGLGLSMIYGFAQQSGGQVRIYSEVGQGTTVCIYLPRYYGVVEDDTAGEQIAELPRSEAGETVLVVDDEPTVRMLITDILEDLGYAAIEAGDSATGLKVLQSDVRIDLLVTDVGLPGGMNGRQMADAARNHRPDLRVLFITGYAENAILGNGMLPPGMAVLTKPFAMDNMAARIRSMIEAGRETRLQRRS
ncbi:PAS sensor protein [Methylobacterium sp. Leaf92]|nr:PAS sensor protein [Methylobacterium sp. Leaf92]